MGKSYRKDSLAAKNWDVDTLNASLYRRDWVMTFGNDEAAAEKGWDQFHRKGILRRSWIEMHDDHDWLTGSMFEPTPIGMPDWT